MPLFFKKKKKNTNKNVFRNNFYSNNRLFSQNIFYLFSFLGLFLKNNYNYEEFFKIKY